MTARNERPKPPITSAKTWSGCARLRCTPVNGFISHADVVLIPAVSCRGSRSWQLSGRKWVNGPESNCGRLQGPLTVVEKVTLLPDAPSWVMPGSAVLSCVNACSLT